MEALLLPRPTPAVISCCPHHKVNLEPEPTAWCQRTTRHESRLAERAPARWNLKSVSAASTSLFFMQSAQIPQLDSHGSIAGRKQKARCDQNPGEPSARILMHR